jgi:hypothetical protein
MSLAKIFTLKSQKITDETMNYPMKKKRINCHRYVGSEPTRLIPWK